MNHVTIGVYANNSHKINIVKPEHLEGHIDYNKTMRFGRGLFVDGKCVHKGYLDDKQVQDWETKIEQMNINTSNPSKEYV